MKFTELELHPSLQKNLDRIQFIDCTPIQADAIPHILNGRDIAGLAQTGTGKTGAFLIPIIDRVLRGMDVTAAAPAGETNEAAAVPAEGEPKTEAPLHLRYFPEWRRRQYVLILVPTRELAEQVFENAEKLLADTGLKCVSVYGGTTYEKQKAAFKDGVEFVIATPGRLIDLYKENIADLRQVRCVIFDEADRMFDMGFKEDMKFILKRIPRERQFLVFSATLNFDVLNTAYEFGAYPVEINISKDQPKAENVTDEILHVGQFDKPKFLLSLLKKHNPRQAIIFSNFKHNVERIARFLTSNGIPAVGISSLLTQAQRNRVMAQFKGENDRNILVATDLAARGLDILGVDMVINFEMPDDPENYVHRIGRTGRAGHKGTALSVVSDRDVDALARIEDYLGHKLPIGWIEDKELVTEMKPFPQDSDRPREGGPRREHGGPRRDQGPRRDRGPRREGRPSSDRPSSGDRQEGRGPRREGQPREGQQRSQQGQHRRQDQRQDQRHASSRGPRHQQGAQSRPKQGSGGPQHRHQGRRHHQGGSRPQAPAAIVAKSSHSSLGQRVTGFFKKLFGTK